MSPDDGREITLSKVTRSGSSSGIAFGAGAFLIWGAFPAFFGLLDFADPLEILAHRVVWTLVLMLIVLAVLGRLASLRGISGRTWLLVTAASAAIAVNWGTYIYAVASGRVVEAALGYFINPLVTVLLGVVIFRERLRRAQIVALALAATAVVVITIDYGKPPIVALVLAGSFATYGLIKKVVPLDPRTSLTAEGVVAAPFAVGYLGFSRSDRRRCFCLRRHRPKPAPHGGRPRDGIAAVAVRCCRAAGETLHNGHVAVPDTGAADVVGRRGDA